MDMSKYSKDSKAQARERLQWQLDVIRENQEEVYRVLILLDSDFPKHAKTVLSDMHKSDRDALLQSGGILTDSQIELLKE